MSNLLDNSTGPWFKRPFVDRSKNLYVLQFVERSNGRWIPTGNEYRHPNLWEALRYGARKAKRFARRVMVEGSKYKVKLTKVSDTYYQWILIWTGDNGRVHHEPLVILRIATPENLHVDPNLEVIPTFHF